MVKKRPAFFYFMLETQERLLKEGRKFTNGLGDVTTIAKPLWEKMPASKKEYYNEMSRSKRDGAGNARGAPATNTQYRQKLDNMGMNIELRDKEIRMKASQVDIDDQIVFSNLPKADSDLVNHPLYLMEFMYKMEYQTDVYQPVEMSLLKFTMNGGIMDEMHLFINPGKAACGSKGPAAQHSKDTHRIPEYFEKAEDDYSSIWARINLFLGIFDKYTPCPSIFVLGNRKEMALYAIDWLFYVANVKGDNPIRALYPLENLLVILLHRERADLSNHNFNIFERNKTVELLLTTDFDYVPHMQCDWHDDLEVRHCTQGYLRKYAYVCCNELSHRYGFELTASHRPVLDDAPSYSYFCLDDVTTGPVQPYRDKQCMEAMRYSEQKGQYNDTDNNSNRYDPDYSDVRCRQTKQSVDQLTTKFTSLSTNTSASTANDLPWGQKQTFKSPWGGTDHLIVDDTFEDAFPQPEAGQSAASTVNSSWGKGITSTTNAAASNEAFPELGNPKPRQFGRGQARSKPLGIPFPEASEMDIVEDKTVPESGWFEDAEEEDCTMESIKTNIMKSQWTGRRRI